ncbi:MAG TPA: gluconate 2-dehydrogenase subunit 3 family protein [Terriglobia bacterium]|nr:gluconate 2-dehydrogenase subunit 3 family protein [Terriglobia bacterium]
MDKNLDLESFNGLGGSRGGMSRREMVRRLALGASAGAALPAVAAAHPIAKHLAGPAAVAEVHAKSAAADWIPAFFDPHQNETFTLLAERIIPGSSQAHVNRFVDLLVSVDTQEVQKKFLASLGAIEAESRRRYSRTFQGLTESEQNEILTVASTAQAATVPENALDLALDQMTLRDHFENLKGCVKGAYYSSEIGMKDLGWDGQVAFTSFPGCQHPDGHE